MRGIMTAGIHRPSLTGPVISLVSSTETTSECPSITLVTIEPEPVAISFVSSSAPAITHSALVALSSHRLVALASIEPAMVAPTIAEPATVAPTLAPTFITGENIEPATVAPANNNSPSPTFESLGSQLRRADSSASTS